MTITINGDSREIPDGLSVAGLIEHLGLAGGRVAVERNREVLSRESWPQIQLADGDKLEIVHFVGGGEISTAIAGNKFWKAAGRGPSRGIRSQT